MAEVQISTATVPSLEAICRLCLCPPTSEESALSSLLVEDRAQMLQILTSIKVHESDPVTDVCYKCLFDLKLAFKIQQHMKESDERLRMMWTTKENQQPVQAETDNNIFENFVDTRYCLICGKFLATSEVVEHMLNHFEDCRRCRACDSDFEEFDHYMNHLRSNHNDGNDGPSFKCPECNRIFFYQNLWDEHMNITHRQQSSANNEQHIEHRPLLENLSPHSETNEKIFETPNFGDDDDDDAEPISELENHSEAVPGLSPNTVAVEITTTDTTPVPAVTASPSSNQPARPRKNKAKDISAMIPQRPRVFQKDGPFSCAECNKVFYRAASYKQHMNQHLRPTEACPICKKHISFSNLHKHIIRHKDDPCVCELCGAVFRCPDNLRSHHNWVHGPSDKHKCDRCDKAFRRKFQLTEHIRKLHDAKPEFVCESCGKAFYVRKRLRLHIRMMHDKVRERCQYCQKEFVNRSSLKTHMRQHTNETPYKCQICGDGFRQNVSLKSHLRSKHGIEEKIVCNCQKCGRGFASAGALEAHLYKSKCA